MDKALTILVVDDEKVVRDGCRRVLTGEGYQILAAENGQIAIESLSKEVVDLILLDLKMPVMNGEEVLEHTRVHYPDIPVIIITGHGTIDTAVDCMKKGAWDFVTKPFQINEFLLTVERAAEKRRLEQRARLFEEENIRNMYDLNLEKSRLKTIINCMANGVMVTNRHLEVVLSNPALMESCEIVKERMGPAPINQFIEDESLIDTLNRIQSGQSAKDEYISQEIRAGKNVLKAISAPVLGPENMVVGTVTVFSDITSLKQLDEMKSDFVNMVAHELRSPLVSIRQQNSVLLEGLAGPLQEKQKHFLDRGMQKIDQLLEMINDLLDIAKLESGIQIQHQVPVDLKELISTMVDFMRPRAQQQGIVLKCKLRNLKLVQADPKSLQEVFNNLITNAINYSPNGGEVVISAEGLGEYVEIMVSDSGVGIRPEDISKIFDRFYRAKHPQTRQVLGTGLGLAIVKRVVEDHRGTIDVESVLDEGTTFRILLPALKQ